MVETKKATSADPIKVTLFAAALLTSLVAVILLLATDFGGWYWYDGYYNVYAYFWIGSEYANPWSAIIIVLLTLGMLFCFVVSVMGLLSSLGVIGADKLPHLVLILAWITALAVVVLTIITAIVFLIVVNWADSTWLDAGFYGALFGGGLTALFLILATRQFRIEPE